MAEYGSANPSPTQPGYPVTGETQGLLVPPKKMKSQDSPKQVTGWLVFSIFTAVLGMFQFGWNTGVVNSPKDVIEDFYNATLIDRYDRQLDSELLWSFTVAVFAVGGMIGGLIGAFWSQKFGRRLGMMYNGFFGVLGGLLMGLSKVCNSFEMIIIGRLVIGFNCGLYTGLSPLYNSEIAPLSIRGAIGTVNQLAVTIGILVSQVLGLSEIMGTERLWPLLLGIAVVPSALQMLLLLIAPESPRHLLSTNREEEAVAALRKLRGGEEVQAEVEEIKKEQESQAEQEEAMSVLELLRTPSLRLPLLVAVVMHMSQQLSGIVCIFYYSTDLFESVGVSPETAEYATSSVGAIMIIMTLVSIPLMDRLGRRTLHLGGLIGMCIVSGLFTLTFALSSKAEWLQYVAMACALLIVVFFGIGPGSIPWLIVAELFSQRPRAAAVSVGVVVNWSCNFIVGLIFPPLQKWLEELVFLPFTILLVLFIIFLWKYLPETKNRTIEDITRLFEGGNKTGKSGTSYKLEGEDVVKEVEGMEGRYKNYQSTDMST